MKKIVIGILAHVDAGKTTLSESMLYLSGCIRQLGRVDHKDAFLDYDQLEKNRGITIFSKQATINWKDVELTLIDTPGHVDFSAEMERTLQILDYAIIVINGLDGVQAHTETIWHLLKHYHIPTFIFVNKMDLSHLSIQELLYQLQQQLDEHCIHFGNQDSHFYENIALCDEKVLDEYLSHSSISIQTIASMIQKEQVYPCFFGSALRLKGISEFLDALQMYTIQPSYPSEFGARVYKITHDQHGNQLTHMKITGGSLRVKETIRDEKVDQIRIYSGLKYDMVKEVSAGIVCAIKGLASILPGDGLGFEHSLEEPLLSSYMNFRVVLPTECDHHTMLENLQQLSKEDPTLHVIYHQQLNEIRIQLMGHIQIEILKHIIYERYGVHVEFDEGRVLYKETIIESVEGVGHYEPLHHYAEVHLLLEPGERGSGLQFMTDISEDILSRNWQRLILTHLKEKEHIGTLIGAPITDIKITLLSGKAHLKHTEGGDFRQATYRAIRHGLKKAKSILLEPYYQFQLEIPAEYLSRALFDIEEMKGQFEVSDSSQSHAIIKGIAPISTMQNYQSEVIAYTKGKGRLFCTLKDYRPCHNQEEVIKEMNYNSESDLDNPTGSVFCSHGAGFTVAWNEVENYMHIPYCYQTKATMSSLPSSYTTSLSEDEELEAIFTRTYGPIERKTSRQLGYTKPSLKKVSEQSCKPACLLVDGYNVIHTWDELRDMAKENLEGARLRLMDMMCNYQGYKNCLLILVFDAYKVKGNMGSSQKYHNIYVVYTKEAQTADMYIERATHQMANDYQITVATSDALEQLITSGAGAYRMSSRELKIDLDYMNQTKQEEYRNKQEKSRNFLLEDVKKYQE